MTSGLPHPPGGADVRAKPLTLPLQVAGQPVVVEAGLADREDLRVIGEADQILGADFALVRIVRVYAHRRVQIRMALGQGEHPQGIPPW